MKGVAFILLFLVACDISDVHKGNFTSKTLNLTAEYELQINEPSGLCLTPDGSFLYTVSDNSNQVFKISTKGKILSTLNYEGDDLEGVAYDKLIIPFGLLRKVIENSLI